MDDDDQFRLALVGLIRSMNYDVRDYASAEAFLSSPDVARTACVITDISMPGISGIELKKRLDVDLKNLPVIIMSAQGEDAAFAEAAATRPCCMLRKPFQSADLENCINRAIDSFAD